MWILLASLHACALAAMPCAQEPEILPPTPSQEQGSEEAILRAIEKLRGSYDVADERVRDGVETPAPGAEARGTALKPAEQALEELVADMEALLALLPKPPS